LRALRLGVNFAFCYFRLMAAEGGSEANDAPAITLYSPGTIFHPSSAMFNVTALLSPG
jgi:hypothetical protein